MIAACACAAIFALWNNWQEYFVWDEWSYWTERHPLLKAHQFAEFFMREHVGHCHAIVMAIWLPLDRVFGLKSYLPYVLPTIVAHCAAGFLLFELLCYTRIRPPVAAVTALLYLFLAAAAGNVSFGWQICLVAPIALCYLALLAIERYADGGSRWLAWLAVASVMLALASSGVGVTVLVVTVLAATGRGRFALAGLIIAIPGGAYLLWRHHYTPSFLPLVWWMLGPYATYTRSGLEATVEGIVQIHITAVAWLLIAGALAAVGASVIRRDRYWSVFAATLAGAVFFYASLSTQRALLAAALIPGAQAMGSPFAPSSLRYVHVASALFLPAFAYLVDRLVSVSRWIALAAIMLAVWAVAANMRGFASANDAYIVDGQRIRAEVAATVALGHHVDGVRGGLKPYGPAAFGLSVAQVQQLAAEGKAPCDRDYPAAVRVAGKLGVSPPPPEAVSCPGGP